MGIELVTPYTKVAEKPNMRPTNKQIGLFVGRFQPVTQAHLVLADQVRQSLNLDKVLFLPEGEDQAGHVVKMLSLALQGYKGFGIDLSRIDSELTLLDSLAELVHANPATDFYFIAGADAIDLLDRNAMLVPIAKHMPIVGVQRPRYRVGVSTQVIWVDSPQMDISSQLVRNMLAKGRMPHFMVPKKVLDYIEMAGLYR